MRGTLTAGDFATLAADVFRLLVRLGVRDVLIEPVRLATLIMVIGNW